jgi:hypothetical protein
MAFQSILFSNVEDRRKVLQEEPDFFIDLNLDQVINAITTGKEEYDLKPFFYTPLHTVPAVHYRHAVMQDLESPIIFETIQSFAQNLQAMRAQLKETDKRYYLYQKERWFLEGVEMYCKAVASLAEHLSQVDLKSPGFLAFREYLAGYARSARFTSLQEETQKLLADLNTIHYNLLIKGLSIRVIKYEEQLDYSLDVLETFDKFKQGAVDDYLAKLPNRAEMNHVEAGILDCVAQLYPDIFSHLDAYYKANRNFLDETIGNFDREIQFYIAYLTYSQKIKRAGLKFCYPQVSETDKEELDRETYDLALANKLIAEAAPVITNDFFLNDPERIIVVSGPNQGGKTTFARTFGQVHYLASLGCPVPGSTARLFLFDRLFTHFEQEEDITNLRGKLQDDLVRMHAILQQATSNSIVIVNEIFTSTTIEDALFLGKKVMEKIIDLDAICVCVTFIDELASLSEKTVSMISTVDPHNPAQRTFKIIRKPADGLSYAIAIAEKYHLTYNDLQERIPS